MDKICRACWHVALRLRVVALLLMLLFLAPNLSRAQSMTVAEMERSLQTQDTFKIVQALNRAKRSQESPELMSFLLKLWNRSEHSQDLPWDIIESPCIKIEIANVLIQASNNDLIQLDREEARQYSRRIATGPNEDAHTTAILNLGLLGHEDDIELLRRIAVREGRETFRPAVIAIARMCSPKGEKALAEVRATVRKAEHKEFANTPSLRTGPIQTLPGRPGAPLT